MRAVLLAAAFLVSVSPQPAAPKTPVLVELFTSEGCSSCPPADRLLSGMIEQQPSPGVEIIGLSLHVDYWDDLGWKDPASMHAATTRQQAYARAFGGDQVYTPEAVIDGAAGVIGSDAQAVRRAIEKASARPKVPLQIQASLDGDRAVVTSAHQSLPATVSEPLDVVTALVEDDVTSAVQRGENRGRSLRHDAVVRSLDVRHDDGAAAALPLRPGWRRDRLRVVAFLQGRRTLHVWGAAAVPLR